MSPFPPCFLIPCYCFSDDVPLSAFPRAISVVIMEVSALQALPLMCSAWLAWRPLWPSSPPPGLWKLWLFVASGGSFGALCLQDGGGFLSNVEVWSLIGFSDLNAIALLARRLTRCSASTSFFLLSWFISAILRELESKVLASWEWWSEWPRVSPHGRSQF